jgi:hypothetical protein
MNLIQSICCFVSRRCGSKAAPKKAARRKLKRAIMVLAHGGLVFHPRFDLPQVVQSVHAVVPIPRGVSLFHHVLLDGHQGSFATALMRIL